MDFVIVGFDIRSFRALMGCIKICTKRVLGLEVDTSGLTN